MFFDLRLSRSKSAALGPVSQQQEGHTFHFCFSFWNCEWNWMLYIAFRTRELQVREHTKLPSHLVNAVVYS